MRPATALPLPMLFWLASVLWSALPSCQPEDTSPVLEVGFVLPEDSSFLGEVSTYTAQVTYSGGEKNGMLLETTFPAGSVDAVFDGLPPTGEGETVQIHVEGHATGDGAEAPVITRATSGPLTLAAGSATRVRLFLGQVGAVNMLVSRLPTGAMGQVAVSFPDGTTLIAGGMDRSGNLTPDTTWFDDGFTGLEFGLVTPGPPLSTPRMHHVAALLDESGQDGPVQAALLGGDTFERLTLTDVEGLQVPSIDLGGPAPLASVETLTPGADGFEAGPPLRSPRAYATALQPSSSTVLLCGGIESQEGSSAISDTCEHWRADGTTNTFGLHYRRVLHQATWLRSGEVLLTGGTSEPLLSPESLLLENEVFDPEAPSPSRAGFLLYPRVGHQAVVIPGTDGEVLVTGGYTREPTPSGAAFRLTLAEYAEIYQPESASSRPFVRGPAMQCPRAFHKAVPVGDGLVLIVGGIGADGHSLPPPELYDHLANDGAGAFLLLDDSDTLCGQGVEASGPLLSVNGPTASRLSTGDVLIGGGDWNPGNGGGADDAGLAVFVAPR